MRFKAVLFDLDGTLLDTLQDLTDSMYSALHQLGFTGFRDGFQGTGFREGLNQKKIFEWKGLGRDLDLNLKFSPSF